jgi:hypothetical protein
MTTDFSDAAFFGAITNPTGDDGFFNGGGEYGNIFFPNKPDNVSVQEWKAYSPDMKQAIIEGGGGGTARVGASGPTQEDADIFQSVAGGIGGLFRDVAAPLIGLAVANEGGDLPSGGGMPQYNQPEPPAASGGGDTAAMMMMLAERDRAAAAERERAYAQQQSQGMSPGLMVMGGLLGLGLFGTLLALLVRGKGSSNRGWANEGLSFMGQPNEGGFSETFVDFI